MSVKTQLSSGTSRGPSTSKCWWLRWQAKALLVLGLRTQAHALFKQILDIHPHDVLALNTLGYNELNDRRLLQALGFFERALALTPANANAHFNVGFVCEALGRSQQAEQAFQKALEIDAKMDRAWYGLGLVLVRVPLDVQDESCVFYDARHPRARGRSTPSFAQQTHRR